MSVLVLPAAVGQLAVLGRSGSRRPARRADGWINADRLDPLIPRELERSRELYRSRGAVERAFGRLKLQWAVSLPCASVGWIVSGSMPT